MNHTIQHSPLPTTINSAVIEKRKIIREKQVVNSKILENKVDEEFLKLKAKGTEKIESKSRSYNMSFTLQQPVKTLIQDSITQK